MRVMWFKTRDLGLRINADDVAMRRSCVVDMMRGNTQDVLRGAREEVPK